jgi:EF-P beta-lysylation protein EpmB
MMMKSASAHKTPWQAALIDAVTDPQELLELLELDPILLTAAQAAAKLFPLKVPRGFIARMQKRNIADPLLRQVLPIGDEYQEVRGFTPDPLGEAKMNPLPGLLHKYQGRVLLTPTGACGVNCRFCFRRHFPYTKNNPGVEGWQQALNYIAEDKSITEVILSGGDPLVMSDTSLQDLTQKLNSISHLKRLRIHSRMPIVLPERITSELITWLTSSRLKPVLVTHCNHPQEINQPVMTAMRYLTESGVYLLNQAVILKGVNDNVATLVNLSEALFAIGILPYYLHLLDKVQGTAHFDIDLKAAQALHSQMAQQLPGYLVPKLVCEQPGAPAKVRMENFEFYTE